MLVYVPLPSFTQLSTMEGLSAELTHRMGKFAGNTAAELYCSFKGHIANKTNTAFFLVERINCYRPYHNREISPNQEDSEASTAKSARVNMVPSQAT